ncbi:MAG: PIN domain-containing protein [Bacteroidota bacterium]|nr:PIN domain-containing protein [Bacteroidota bacterium]
MDVDRTTSQHYGTIVAALYKKGKPLPINDVWIAAVALQYELTVVSRDKHFNEIDGLKIKVW